MKSPNGRCNVTKIDYNETRMGGPLIGRLRIDGGRLRQPFTSDLNARARLVSREIKIIASAVT